MPVLRFLAGALGRSRHDDVRVIVAIVAMGNPYLLSAFPKTAAYLATFSSTPPSEVSAVKALFGEIPIGGHMPVTIPGFAKLGDGIQLPARSR